MMHLALIKTPMGYMLPATEDDAETVKGIKTGATIHADFQQMRNVKFHRKFFAMLKLGFDAWEPPEVEFRGLPVQKNFERFRKDCTIAAGYYYPAVSLNGEVRAEAKSIAFGNMDETEFEKVYSDVANVLLQRILRTYTRKDLDAVVDQMLAFT